jgi:hypothetical protein
MPVKTYRFNQLKGANGVYIPSVMLLFNKGKLLVLLLGGSGRLCMKCILCRCGSLGNGGSGALLEVGGGGTGTTGDGGGGG